MTPFTERHIGPDKHEVSVMLERVGAGTLDELIGSIIPGRIRLETEPDIPAALSELEFLREIREVANRNRLCRNYIGLGYYDCAVPGVIQRNIFENPGWYTAYTPYQAEISQGRMEALLNFQTMVSDLTGMDLANASLLDEATAAAEAMAMFFHMRSRSQAKAGAVRFFVAGDCFPQTVEVVKTRAEPLGIEVICGAAESFEPDEKFFGVLLQYPDGSGSVRNGKQAIARWKKAGVKTVVAADIMSLVLLEPPGQWDVDAVVGTTQRFGVPVGYGGPHAAYFATRSEYKRHIPGRIIGVSLDASGSPALRMALQTREQHIKRERATSNICTAQVLLAVMAGMYAVYHGPGGLKGIAAHIHRCARLVAAGIRRIGFKIVHDSFFDTVMIETGTRTDEIRALAEAAGINFRYEGSNVLISAAETMTEEEIRAIWKVFSGVSGQPLPNGTLKVPEGPSPLESVTRRDEILVHPVFNSYHSETRMLRYIAQLEKKDLSLNHSMIPLGSCTMKLNATSEMIPVSWNHFGRIHPFQPGDQAGGYAHIISELEAFLCEITGFSAVSLQPNSGAQGEFTGLMVIRRYFSAEGESHRNVVLIPQSAHGTNPASAIMAGMKIVIVKCDADGNIDQDDLKEKAEQHSHNLAALMVTYPSTHGVYEEGIRDVTDVIHAHGGQVYMDGANMNAQVGLTNPSIIGADVCHINLHKTFAIPHGGGGPGMGPIGVAQHLAPHLPTHPLVAVGGNDGVSAVSAAPWGSASILLISYAYIKLLGREGLTESTKIAILNANYIRKRLEEHYPILYRGRNGNVAHELILDCRSFRQRAGIDVSDIAKRLMDYGFHAPTVAFPVPGTLMVEPTESESLGELDRFCEAMIAIKSEIVEIENGKMPREDNVLVNAPHTAVEVAAGEWPHPYSRMKAAFPAPWVTTNKFWPAVKRVDNAFGDRNLVCTCPPVSAYDEIDREEGIEA